MIAALENLLAVPGVSFVMLTSPDGVPIVTPGDQGGASSAGLGSEDALAALTSVWFSEVAQHTSQLSWNQPTRAVLRASRGTLVLQHLRNAVLLVLLARGTEPEDVRLAMEGTVGRIDRSVRGMGRSMTASSANSSTPDAAPSEPRSPLPAILSTDSGADVSAVKGQEAEDTSGN
ncbi:MAG: putative regulator of Ras-like GTPase activity (Roadblock/LC7/MglB family) [Planctomycetota bacterium]